MDTPARMRWCLQWAACAVLLIACHHRGPHITTSVEKSIRDFASEWMGTPYKLGGMDKNGIDCSALTQHLYKDVFHVDLPRRVVDQRVEGERVSRDSLEAGDLIVFKGKLFGHPHIGVYLSDGDFMHASSSRGVMISNLGDYYWKRKFSQARRLLDPSGRLLVRAD